MTDRTIDDTNLPPLSETDLRDFRPARDVLPASVLAAFGNKGGRPRAEVRKQSVTLRLDPRILDFYRGGGAGWQTRINADLAGLVSSREAEAG